MKRALFVYPKVSYLYNQTPYPPLGIGYLAAQIANSCAISVIDGQIVNEGEYALMLDEAVADFVLISTTLFQLKEGLRVADAMAARLPAAKIILGGPAFGAVPINQLVANHNVDVVVVGEAELVIHPIITNTDLTLLNARRIEGTARAVEIHANAAGRPDICRLSLPLWEVLSIERYMDRWRSAIGMTSLHILGSRGCPFDCFFCDKTVTGNRYRPRTVVDVVDEVSTLVNRYRPDDLFYYDDLFTFNEERVIETCQQLLKRVPGVTWSAQGHVNTLTEGMLAAMTAAGCRELYFGVETGSPRLLEFLGKRTSPCQIAAAFDKCHRFGIKPGAYLIVGIPGETKEDIDATIALVERIRPAMINFSFLTPFPGTIIFEKTRHLIAEWDFSRWDDFSSTVYDPSCFAIDPGISRDRIKTHFDTLVRSGCITPCDWYRFDH